MSSDCEAAAAAAGAGSKRKAPPADDAVLPPLPPGLIAAADSEMPDAPAVVVADVPNKRAKAEAGAPACEQRVVLFGATEQKLALMSADDKKALLAALRQEEEEKAQEKKEDDEEENMDEQSSSMPSHQEFVNRWMKDAKAKWALLEKGDEVSDVSDVDLAMYLLCKYNDSNIHWMQFLNMDASLNIWKNKKKATPYATFEVKLGTQTVGDVEVEWPDKFVVLGPAMVCEFPKLGAEGNFKDLNVGEFGPKKIDELTYSVMFTNAKYSRSVCDKSNRNPLATKFMDWLDALLQHCIRKLWDKGHFQAFRDLQKIDIDKANKPLKDAYTKACADAKAKKKDAPEAPELVPYPPEDDEMLSKLQFNEMSKTDFERDMRTMQVKRSLYQKLKVDKDMNVIGEDTSYEPPHTEHGIFSHMLKNRQVVINDRGEKTDERRKQWPMRYWLPRRPDEGAAGDDGLPLAGKAWPFKRAPADFKAVNGMVFVPVITLNFYEWISCRAGITEHIYDMIYVGMGGKLNDNPPTPCNPLLAIPCATAYVASPPSAEEQKVVASAAAASGFSESELRAAAADM